MIGLLPFLLDEIHRDITIYILEFYTSHLSERNTGSEEINMLHNHGTKE